MRTQNHRSPREIRKDLRSYLSMAAAFYKYGEYKFAEEYSHHAAAMQRELELVRTGRVLSC